MSSYPNDDQPGDLRHDYSSVVVAERLATRCIVEFAAQAGVVLTLEGPVRHQAGAAIITGVMGEQWPVSRGRFAKAYEAEAGTVAGCSGYYLRKPQRVLAYCLSVATEVTLSGKRGTLLGKPGDWIVEYAPGDRSVVEPGIFARTYRLEEYSEGETRG